MNERIPTAREKSFAVANREGFGFTLMRVDPIEKREDLKSVQGLRGVACLLVVVYHALQAWGSMTGGKGIELWENGSAGVDLFFIISGFVMVVSTQRHALSKSAWRLFLVRRLQRIVPLYWLFSAAKLGLVLTLPSLTPHTSIDLWNGVASFLFIPSRDATGTIRPVLPVGWSLEFEMLFYILFAASLWLGVRPLRLLLPVLLPLAVAGFWSQPDWPSLSFLAQSVVVEFCFGVAIGQVFLSGWRISPIGGAALVSGGTMALLTLPFLYPWRGLVWGVPAAAILAGAVALEESYGQRVPKNLLLVGEASYAVYLVHPFVVPPIAACERFLHLGLPALIAASLLGSTAAGLLIHRTVDRPIQQGLLRARRSQAAASAHVAALSSNSLLKNLLLRRGAE